jgi:hypothetical protein
MFRTSSSFNLFLKQPYNTAASIHTISIKDKARKMVLNVNNLDNTKSDNGITQ